MTDKITKGHPIIANVLIIVIVAALGLVIAYLCLDLFTKHGQTDRVPGVVNLTYSGAVEKLHAQGFKVEIRDSLFLDNVKPGQVVEQFPAAGAVVKPGRKVFLYIQAVHPKEVVLDPGGDPRQPALKGYSLRQAKAHLTELGFKNVRIIYVLGEDDRVVKVLANGHQVMKQEKVPVNAQIVMEVYDGRLSELADSLRNAEEEMEMRMQQRQESYTSYPAPSPAVHVAAPAVEEEPAAASTEEVE